nr:retrovirus-related Pol polyprotein from transposon TNT 1-94 [Tanacetum cinerariifolium]
MDESGFEKIAGASTAKQAWDTMEKGYKGVDRVKQNVVCAIEESKDLEDLTIEELAGCLEAHEQIKNKKKQESLDEALKTKATIKDEKESEQRGKHFNQNSRGRGRGRGRGGQGYRPSVDCYNCGKQGHYARDYRSVKRTEEKTNLVTEVEESGVLLMAHEESISKIDTMWYLDFGASNHMSGQKDLFVEITEVVQGHVSFGDASKIYVKGCGKIPFFQNGKESIIEDVYYVPTMKSNILSLGQLMEIGYWVLMKNGKLLLKNKEGVIISLVKMGKNRTFKLKLSNVNRKCLKADLSDEESVWHLRFGHLHFNGLKELTRKNMKSKALETFKKFKALVEKTTGKCIKALQSDRGGEYVSTPFTTFCEEEGIKKFLTAPYSPQQNRIAERKNQTIMNMSGAKPTVSHFRVFGNVAYAHVPDQTRKKLDDKSKMYIFIGYDERTKAFRLYDPIKKKVIVSRDVFVNEERTWDWSNEFLYDPHNNTEHDAREVSIPTALSDPTVVTTDSENDDEPIQPRMRSLQYIYIYNNTTEMHLVCLLADNEDITHKPIGVKWVYKKKMNATREIQRYKARLVAKGYRQKAGIDYDEIFVSVSRMETIRLLALQAAQNGWKIYQMDVKFAFLNGVLDEVVYIEQPPGYMKVGEETKVLKLKKALYGLKQAPRA